MLTRLESDKIVDNWMNLRIDFDAVAKQQKDEPFDTTKLYKSDKIGTKYNCLLYRCIVPSCRKQFINNR